MLLQDNTTEGSKIALCEKFYGSILITLSLPLWTFATLFSLGFLVYFLKRVQNSIENAVSHLEAIKGSHQQKPNSQRHETGHQPIPPARKKPKTITSAQTPIKAANKRPTTDGKKHRANERDETMDNAYNSDGVYIKTKNRDSISQYV